MHVLLIEDNAAFQFKIINVLNILGYKFQVVTSVHGVQEKFTSTEKFDLIVADIMLSDGLIFDISLWPDIPTLFITAHEKEEYLESSMYHSGSLFLNKPFSDLSLRAAIQRLSEQSKALAQKTITVFGKYNNPIELPEQEVLFIDAQGNYSTVVTTADEKYVVKRSAKYLRSKLSPALFIRIQRSIYVNKTKLTKVLISKSKVFLEQHSFSVSRNYKKGLYEFHHLDPK
jgi:DNA-binding LytR/AlgR family response regulator